MGRSPAPLPELFGRISRRVTLVTFSPPVGTRVQPLSPPPHRPVRVSVRDVLRQSPFVRTVVRAVCDNGNGPARPVYDLRRAFLGHGNRLLLESLRYRRRVAVFGLGALTILGYLLLFLI